MESIKLLELIEHIPKSDSIPINPSSKDLHSVLELLKDRDVIIQAGLYSSIIGYQILETRNIPDALFDAYASQYPQEFGRGVSLYDKYKDVMERGENSVTGLVSGIKGKFFEFHVQKNLTERYPGFNFEVAELANQPIWDIRGTNENTGEEILIQVKVMGVNQANNLAEIMERNPDVYYATSSEIREKILAQKPELKDQFIPIDISNYEFTKEVQDGLETLRENLGVDLPDEIFALAPYSTEIILGIRLLLDVANVNRDFKQVQATDKARLSAVKVLILMSRFSVNTILGAALSAGVTTVFPGIGTTVGGIVGVTLGNEINKKIAPYSSSIAYSLLGLKEEDVFYFINKEKVSNLAIEYRNNTQLLYG